MRTFAAVAVLSCIGLCAGCASYVTPGGPARFAEIRGDADSQLRQPSPDFPANLGAVRVQASQYESASSRSLGKGAFSVVNTQELLTDDRLQAMSKWSSVESASTLDRALMPTRFESVDDLRLAAAKLQVDVLLVYTLDTQFQAGDQRYAPGAKFSAGKGDDASVSSAAAMEFVDVRTGYVYGSVEASAQASLAEAKGEKGVDTQRLAAERQAFDALLVQAEQAWAGIEQRYQ